MRKQTKIAAIVSAAALLAVGASMTSFAATGWQEEDGTWVYYNKAEEKVTDKWAKSGDNWFYLDADGYMATDMLIEDDEDYYYVDANGAMVRNQWIAIDNEDAGNDDDEPEVHWYYFQNNGKAYRKKGSSNVFKKSINGKTYAFNDDAQMMFGWVDADGNMNSDDDAWKEGIYYFGDENDGAMSTGWRLISIVDEDCEELQPGDAFWDEDQDRWFWFKSSGKKQTAKDAGTIKTDKTINGKKYGFDEYGRMVADWITPVEASAVDGDHTESDGTKTQGQEKYTESFLYFSTPEDGARYTKGWFKVVPGYYLHEDKYEDGDSYWYYADGKGKIVASEIKTIKGKKYLFDSYGRMKKGLQLVEFGEDDKHNIDTKKAAVVYADDSAEYKYANEDEFDDIVKDAASLKKLAAGDMAFMFFSSDEDHDGSEKTGKQTINLDGDQLVFRFYTSGVKKGQGINGVKDKKIYRGGKLLKADSDNKVEFYDTTENKKITISDLLDDTSLFTKTVDGDKTKWKFIGDKATFAGRYIAINTSGTVLTSGTKKDGDDYKIKLKKEGTIEPFKAHATGLGSVTGAYVTEVELK